MFAISAVALAMLSFMFCISFICVCVVLIPFFLIIIIVSGITFTVSFLFPEEYTEGAFEGVIFP